MAENNQDGRLGRNHGGESSPALDRLPHTIENAETSTTGADGKLWIERQNSRVIDFVALD
jgi:hypothetical protein